MIYPVRIFDEFGGLIRELSAKYLQKTYWERFMDEEQRRNRKSLKFGARTQIQKHLFVEKMCDEFITTQGD